MLELRDICREYHTGDTVTKALDHVNITFRDNEFTAILGPSGSGKTTLLNIIGGLDRYTSGDLVINGISTRKYTDRDFDAYRNHTIGFIFQSYNLISHQTVLANVELALTISGISGKEKRKRAVEALTKVGLKDHLYKKPAQLSGGQMQRVAIARALVNDPDIVLADEPTGALDTKTSIQVMDLLKEVAKDREVIMVTHNPQLARQYATRIVTIRDGHVIDDTDPVRTSEHLQAVNSRFRHTAMNFLTALSLSFNNLKTKKGRTFMVSFAGSIGIIGIALLLAINTGLSSFIETEESEALSAYPLEIYDTGIDVSSLVNSGSQTVIENSENEDVSFSSFFGKKKEKEEQTLETIRVNTMAEDFLSGVNANDLGSLKQYLDSSDSHIDAYAGDVEYSYGVTPQIYQMKEDGSAEQVNPSKMMEDILSSTLDISSLVSGTIGESAFHALPGEPSLYEDAYTVEAGRWPENSHEMVLVLNAQGEITDLLMYELGIWDSAHLKEMVNAFTADDSTASALLSLAGSSEEETAPSASSAADSAERKEKYDMQDFIGRQYKLVMNSDSCSYDESLGLWVDHSDDASYMSQIASQGEDMTIVGVVMPEGNSRLLTPGVYYPRELIQEIMQKEKNSDAVKAQLASPDRDIFTGQSFAAESSTAYDYGKFFTLDHDEVSRAFIISTDSVDENMISSLLNPVTETVMNAVSAEAKADIENRLASVDLSSYLDAETILSAVPPLTEEEINALVNSVNIKGTEASFDQALQNFTDGFLNWYSSQYGDLESQISQMEDSFVSYLSSEEAAQALSDALQTYMSEIATEHIHTLSEEEIRQILSDEIAAYLSWVDEKNEGQSQQVDPADGNVLQIYFSSEEGQKRLSDLVQKFMPSISDVDEDEISALKDQLIQSWQDYVSAAQLSVPDVSQLQQAFADYLNTEDARKEIVSALEENADLSAVEKTANALVDQKLNGASETLKQQYAGKISEAVEQAVNETAASLTDTAEKAGTSAVSEAISQASAYINAHTGDFFTIDQDAFRQAIHMDISTDQMQSILNSLLSGSRTDLSGNLRKLGYADPDEPTMISIYARTFEDKTKIADVLDDYNDAMKEKGEDDKVISYTDVIAAMMDSITSIISTVSEILIAFVAISLVVSSIMIGVITYISVLERRKEIGILRALGASRHNIREVFNAETFITGLLSGLLGIGFTFLLIPLVDYLIYRYTGQVIQAWLPLKYCIGLVLLSVFLTVAAGLIPSGRAAASDPVKALRTE